MVRSSIIKAPFGWPARKPRKKCKTVILLANLNKLRALRTCGERKQEKQRAACGDQCNRKHQLPLHALWPSKQRPPFASYAPSSSSLRKMSLHEGCSKASRLSAKISRIS